MMAEFFWWSLICSMITVIGALPILFFRQMPHRWKDILLAFTAGIMVAASTYALIPAALKSSNLIVLTIGILCGTFALLLLEKFLPHDDPKHSAKIGEYDADAKESTSSSHMFMIAMLLHNVPEGLSVGVSFASEEEYLGPLVAYSIAAQNAPEGFLIALYLFTVGMQRVKALGIAFLAGMIEFMCAWLGYYLSAVAVQLIPYGLSFAAGAMLFIVYKELIPESHGDGYEREATFAFIMGLLVMIWLTHVMI